jgi:lysophospholipase L1-like esterase
MSHDWYRRPDGLYVVDDAVPVADARERSTLDRLIDQWGAPALRESRRTGAPWRWILSIMRVESGGSPKAISRKKDGSPIAYGLMQIIPKTFRTYVPNATEADFLDADTNLAVGAQILADLRKRHDDLAMVSSEYNAGPGPHPSDGNEWGMRQECVGDDCYVDRVLRGYNYLVLRGVRAMLLGDSIFVGAAPFVAASLPGNVDLVGALGAGAARHEAVVGESIAKIGARLDAAVERNAPNVIVTMAGANDVPGNASPEAMAAAEAKVLARAAKVADAVVVVAIPPQPASVPKGRGDVPAAYNRALAAEVQRLSDGGLPVVFVDPQLNEGDMAADGVHPNVSGDRKIATVIERALSTIAALPREVVVPDVAPPWYRRPLVVGAAILAVGYGSWRYFRS